MANEWLDMAENDVSVHWASQRFSDILTDSFSTDFELPMTARNLRLLDVWSVLNRGAEPYGDMVACQVMMQGYSSDALLSVTGCTESAIQATVYLANLPVALRKRVRELVHDSDDTIMDFTQRALEGATRQGEANFTWYLTNSSIVRPNVKVSYILEQIAAAANINMPVLSDDYRIIGTSQVVAPYNRRQALLLSWYGGQGEWLKYGQHITNEVDTDNGTVVMNRQARMQLTAFVRPAVITGETNTPVTWLQVRSNGGSWQPVAQLETGAVGTVSITTTPTLTLPADVEWRIYCYGWMGQAFLDCTYYSYNVYDDDYNVKLNFDVNADYSLPTWVTGDTVSYVYFGVMANIPDITVRELLSSLSWMLGQRIEVQPLSVAFTQTDVSKSIQGRILSYEFACDKLGQVTRVESADGGVLASTQLFNTKLADEVTLHKSIFAQLYGAGVWGTVELDLYRDDNGTWVAEDYKGGVAIAKMNISGSGTYYLMPVTEWSMFGVDALQRVCMIEAVTREDLNNTDYAYIDGHKYMLIEGDRDEITGLTTFKGLLV